ncbi:glycosyltransferase family 2 protein [uncultured Methanobrevibacter sp.]|uniref:glycosyltransferase family 2 protein n=1 Tax=uncultured Methanobrevibacter sp. TaxID=253161 RepID=UPI0025D85545|nr:glycosyltransferase family 2 protein [uncultured Methanobrevibacter sp.]
MYKISIIMPIFNAEDYIERSFKSILNQTMDLSYIEVIMVDDNSTDKTKHIVEEYEHKYSNFKAVYHENNSGGCAIPRNSGLKIATGEYVMFLDPDDEYAPDMCEILYNKIKSSDAQVVKCNHKLINPETSEIDYQFDENISEKTINCKNEMPPSTSSVCNAIHDRKFLERHNLDFANLKNAEDILFSIEEFFNADKFIILNNYAGYYYYRNETTSHAKKPTSDNLNAILDAYILTKKVIEQHGREEILHPFFSKRCIQFLIMLLDYPGNKKKYLEKFYEFEKGFDVPLTFELLWTEIVNKFIVKNHITTAVLIYDGLNLIRKSPLVEIYRKLT